MFDLDKTVVEFHCPSCKYPNAATIREMRFGLTILCRGCKTRIRLMPKDAGLTRAKRMLDDFISEFPKKIDINIKF